MDDYGRTVAVVSAPLNMLAASRVGVAVTVSGEVIAGSDAPTSIAGVRFNAGGTVEKYEDGLYSQIDAATDWRIPNTGGAKTYHVRATENAQIGTGNRVGTLGSWIALSSSPEWTVEETTSGQSATWDLDIEVSDDGGSTTLDTGLFELTATVP